MTVCLRKLAPPGIASGSTADATAALDAWVEGFASSWRSSSLTKAAELSGKKSVVSSRELYELTLKQTMDKFQVNEQDWSPEAIGELIDCWSTSHCELIE